MVTIYDIAKRCNCSSATVSKVFNNVGNISEKKRREVLAVARELGYVPNVTARNLVKKRSNTVGVLLCMGVGLGLISLYFGASSAAMGGLFFVGMFVFLAGLILPVIGCAIGVVCLCFKECRGSRPALACAILAVALPVAALLLTILLFSTGVWVISLM